MRRGTLLGITLVLAGLALAATSAAVAQAQCCGQPVCCGQGGGASSSSSSSAGGASASASAGAGSSSSSSSSSSSAGGGGGQQQQQQQQQMGGGTIVIVTRPPVAPVAVNGGVVTVLGTGTSGTATPVTQVFTPPQEIVLSSQPTQVFTPPRTVTTPRVVYVNRTAGTYTPPPVRSDNLPFTGSSTVVGLIAGLALICGGALLLLRRRDWMLQRTLDEQTSALAELARR